MSSLLGYDRLWQRDKEIKLLSYLFILVKKPSYEATCTPSSKNSYIFPLTDRIRYKEPKITESGEWWNWGSSDRGTFVQLQQFFEALFPSRRSIDAILSIYFSNYILSTYLPVCRL